MSVEIVTLTDVARGIWLDTYRRQADQADAAAAAPWTVSKRTLRGGVSDGVDVVELDNGTLSVSVLPTRGMGLWRGTCQGVPLGWESPVRQPVHPAYIDARDRGGIGWLDGFNEWLCRCGLAWNGPPGNDVIQNEDGSRSETFLTLHGKVANLPAHRVELTIRQEADANEPAELSLTGTIDEATVFGTNLELSSTVSTRAGSNRLRITDTVRNRASRPAELQLLYHTNIGPPFLDEGGRVLVPSREVAPRDARAAEGADDYAICAAPTPGFSEQVYYVRPRAGAAGETLALLRNRAGDRGMSVRFRPDQLPCFAIWKNTAAERDGYVTGLEPGTNFPNFKTFERRHGRVVALEPGQEYAIALELAVHLGSESVRAAEQEIAALQGDLEPRVHGRPTEPFAPEGG